MHKCAVMVLLLAGISGTAAGQSPLFVNQLEAGMTVTTQGCVRASDAPGAYVFTQVSSWPIARNPEGPFGPRHFAIRLAEDRLRDFVGDTLQFTGRITNVRKSEIELEPGLNRYGEFIEFERPDRHVKVRPEAVGLQLDRRFKRNDIPITLLEYEVHSVMRVMKGCLPLPAAAAAVARQQ